MPPVFLSVDDVLQIHGDQIEKYGGSLGVRDMGLLESALAVPQSGIGGQYFHEDVVEMAAAYLFHIVKNHPFIDGNKRVGTMAAYTFLGLNGQDLDAPPPTFEKLVLSVADGKTDKATVTVFLRKHVSRR